MRDKLQDELFGTLETSQIELRAKLRTIGRSVGGDNSKIILTNTRPLADFQNINENSSAEIKSEGRHQAH